MSKNIIIILISLTLSINNSIACDCFKVAGKTSSSIIFSGEVKKVKEKSIGNTTYFQVKFKAVEQHKGNAAKSQIIYTSTHLKACGYEFAVGKSYMVYVSEEQNGKPIVSLCSHTNLIEAHPEYILDDANM